MSALTCTRFPLADALEYICIPAFNIKKKASNKHRMGD